MRFSASYEPEPGPGWAAHFARSFPEYRSWFLIEGDSARPPYLACRRALEEHLPQLLPTWERLCELAGGGDEAARLLSLWCPPHFFVACSQVVWLGDEPALIRNYDYHPERCERLILSSAWGGTRVIASIDCLWGALDGMNEHGVAVSLAFGGRKVTGPGFAIPLLLRGVLQTARNTDEALALLCRVPSHMAYNVALVDKDGREATVWLGPDRPAQVVAGRVSTNHQSAVEWPEHAAATATLERAELLAAQLQVPRATVEDLLQCFLRPPVRRSGAGLAYDTLYTAIYRPRAGKVEYLWPLRSWTQSFAHFNAGDIEV